MLDLTPATDALAQLVRAVPDTVLDRPTPCDGKPVAWLLEHVHGFAIAFTRAARKLPAAPVRDPAGLPRDWRVLVPIQLSGLADAWHGSAWTGDTEAAGVPLPARVAGLFALDELVVHGWDLATATGQPFAVEDGLLRALHGFLTGWVSEHPEGSPGLFAAPRQVPADAALLDRVLGLTGRSPGEQGPGAARDAAGQAGDDVRDPHRA